MVWGLQEPSSFGMYYPNGEYVGWKDRLEAYWRNEMSEEEKTRIEANHPSDYISYVTRKFSGEIGTLIRHHSFFKLTPLLPHECPDEFRTENNMREIGALMLGLGLIVSEPLKALIEGLEPGVHLFWPLRITGQRGSGYPGCYYGMQVRRHLDSFCPELSVTGCFTKSDSTSLDWYYSRGDTKLSYAGLAMSESVIDDAHIWYERRLRDPRLFISDTLQAEIRRAGLKVWKHNKMKSV